jgi:hypothetical protein
LRAQFTRRTNLKLAKYLVVLGLDAEKKPHAAKFDIVEEKAIRKAANLMELRIGKPKSKESDSLINKLPDGRLFASGRGLVPFVRPDIYEQLLKVLELEPENTAKVPTTNVAPVADPWSAIKPSAIVLCRDPLPEPSWWECVVVSVERDHHTMTVRWQNYPTLAAFKVKRAAVAIPPTKR